jgi:ubiquinone/menaquinone biosynthesis C-methylase UbiE
MDLQISFPRGPEHATRLRFLSGVAWSNPDALFRRVGLAPGMRCLDVRCGAGELTLAMARLAGTGGMVLGIDLDERLLVRAREEAARQGIEAEFRRGDVAELEGGAGFDLVYTRFLLSRRPRDEAEDALKRMMQVVRPGGTIVVEDFECPPDVNGRAVDNPAYTRFLELYHALVDDEESEPPKGQQLPELLEHAGVEVVYCSETPTPVPTGPETRNPAALVLDSIRHAIVAARLATRTEVDRLASELDRYRSTPQSLFWLPRIVQAWGTAPEIGGGL